MNSDQLKLIQAPLKEKYRNDPSSAFITLRASGKIGDNISCKVETGKTIIEAGLHKATGGEGIMDCSGDLLLESLVACAGVTLNAVATAIEFRLEDAIIEAEGDLDFRGTLGVSKDAPVGFKAIRLTFKLKTKEDDETIASLIRLTERYCVVYQTLCTGVPVNVDVQQI